MTAEMPLRRTELSICAQWEDVLNDRLFERASRGARDCAAGQAREAELGSVAACCPI